MRLVWRMSSAALLEDWQAEDVWALHESREEEDAISLRRDGGAIEQRDAPGWEIAARFDVLADELEEAAAALSSTRRGLALPAYMGILALGEDAIPLLLRRLQTTSRRPIFLRLLASLTAFQPGAGRETVEEAAAEWVRWGKREGRID